MAQLIDPALALSLLIVFAPLMILIAAAIFFSDPGPILFSHRRIGRGGRPSAA